MVEKLLAYMEKNGLDGFFFAKRENVRYISEFTGADSYLFITKEKQYFLTDLRYTEQASIECPNFEIYVWRKPGKSLGDAVEFLSEKHGLKHIGFEADGLNYGQYLEFSKVVKTELVPTNDVVEKMRSIKTPQEIQYQRVACDISCRAFERLLKDIRVGVTEKELAAKLSLYMVLEGADTQPYGNILISGARTSLLHGIPSEKAVEYGDFVLMDFGCQYKGYMSDMTRTVIVGKPDAKQREVYDLEKRMVEDALAEMKAGVPVKDVYKASIRAIENTEYLPYHYTGIGHGIGLFVHEMPFMGPNYETVLEEGNVRTIEPGIYIPNWGGVRIEDQILITKDGYENMISTTHELIEL
ncbi:MAG: Xaa-Pro peptidase family protein [Clostridiales bacterium]|jgi:Xaa-Pro aminopeptidase|nr:Xaa-Pro peptidase family protein [Clostridiales bacterium]MCI2161345.1 Xaa-Pro peptidase family protein [Oscillospiraceae bacterium]CAB1244609.1 Aminopeptidase YpdF [Ruminococcaceae bacterium BL-4]MCI1962452.1 Xaa-Pro peptidase family protein [Clostridiales bacterium]MCI2022720.1 Xaa-Pro peptidase family protein [Clostridiales bacterium]